MTGRILAFNLLFIAGVALGCVPPPFYELSDHETERLSQALQQFPQLNAALGYRKFQALYRLDRESEQEIPRSVNLEFMPHAIEGEEQRSYAVSCNYLPASDQFACEEPDELRSVLLRNPEDLVYLRSDINADEAVEVLEYVKENAHAELLQRDIHHIEKTSQQNYRVMSYSGCCGRFAEVRVRRRSCPSAQCPLEIIAYYDG